VDSTIDTSGKALLEFWKRVGDKGEVNPNTAQSYRGTCAQVLSVIDDWQTVDVRTLDPDDVFRRFVNKNSSKFKQGSLQAYQRRWPVAVKGFLEYAANPTNWKPPASDRPVIKREKNGASVRTEPEGTPSVTESLYRPPAAAAATGLVEYPFPLRDGRLAYLRLPVDLKFAEVKRLTAFLNTLAVDGESA
jgi:hypothetical protein